MVIAKARWKVADHAKGSIAFTKDGRELVWSWREDETWHSRVFTSDQTSGEDRAHGELHHGTGYSKHPTPVRRSPSEQFALESRTGLQSDGYYNHDYVTDYSLMEAEEAGADETTRQTHPVCSCDDHERFFSHQLTDQGILVYSRDKKLMRFDSQRENHTERFTTLADGWRGLFNVPQSTPDPPVLVGIDPESTAGAIFLNEDGYIAHTYTTDAPWMGYIEDVDWASKHALLGLIGRNASSITTMSQRCGLVDLENNRHAHSEPLGATIDKLALRPGHAEFAALCADGHLHWLGVEW